MNFQALKRAAGRDPTVAGGGCVELSMSHRQITVDSETEEPFGSCLLLPLPT